MSRISAEEALGALSLIGQLKTTIEAQNEFITRQGAELARVQRELDAAKAENPPQEPMEGGEKK